MLCCVVGFPHLSPVYGVLQADNLVCDSRVLEDDESKAPGPASVPIVAHESLEHGAEILKEGPAEQADVREQEWFVRPANSQASSAGPTGAHQSPPRHQVHRKQGTSARERRDSPQLFVAGLPAEAANKHLTFLLGHAQAMRWHVKWRMGGCRHQYGRHLRAFCRF